MSPAGIDWSLKGRAFYSALATTLEPLVWPFVVGNLVLGAVAGFVAFVLLRSLLLRRQSTPTAAPPG